MAEGQRRDGGGISVELAETLLIESVPNIDESVGSTRRERVVLIVKCCKNIVPLSYRKYLGTVTYLNA